MLVPSHLLWVNVICHFVTVVLLVASNVFEKSLDVVPRVAWNHALHVAHVLVVVSVLQTP